MAENKVLNALLALIEERPEIARSLLRHPDVPVLDVGTIQGRIAMALDKAKAFAVSQAVRGILSETLSLPLPIDPHDKEIFLQGVTAVETKLEQIIYNCQLLLQKEKE